MSNHPDFAAIEIELRALTPPLVIGLRTTNDDEAFSDALRTVAEELSRRLGTEVLRPGEEVIGAAPAAPALTLTRKGRGVVHYLALPAGPEEQPFLTALGVGAPPRELGDDTCAALAAVVRPAVLLVFIAEACPHCPRAVHAALQVAAVSPAVTVAVVDAQRYPALAARYRVQSAPTTVLDDGLARIGVHTAAETAADVLARGTEDFAAEVFRSLVETGRFDDAARRIVEDSAADQFLALWRTSATSSRIGLLLTAERVLEQGDAPLHPIADGLAAVARTEDVALRGDTADLLGRLAHPAARAALEKLRHDPDPDVAEIAAEALDQG